MLEKELFKENLRNKDAGPRSLRSRTTSERSVTFAGSLGNIPVVVTQIPDDISTNTDDVIEAPDGGWGWVILVAAFLVYTTQGFIYTGSAVLYVALVEHFSADRGVTGWIVSLYPFTGNILGVMIGALITRYGARSIGFLGAVVGSIGISLSYFMLSIPYLCFVFGFIGGVGSTQSLMGAAVSLQQYFNKKRNLATGIGTLGLEIGGLVSAPIINCLLENYGLSGTFLLVAAIWLHNAIFASLYRPLSTTKKKTDTNHNDSAGWKQVLVDMFDFSALKNIQLVLFLIGTLLFNYGALGFFGHYFSRMVYLGIDRDLAIILQVVMMIATGVGRITFSFIGNLKTVDRALIYGATVTIGGLVIFSFPVARTTIPVAIFGISHGLLAGSYFAVQFALIVDVAGISQIPKVMGLMYMTFGIVNLTAVPLAGFLVDVSDSYDPPYYVIGSMHTVGGIVLLALAVIRRRKRKPKTINVNEE